MSCAGSERSESNPVEAGDRVLNHPVAKGGSERCVWELSAALACATTSVASSPDQPCDRQSGLTRSRGARHMPTLSQIEYSHGAACPCMGLRNRLAMFGPSRGCAEPTGFRFTPRPARTIHHCSLTQAPLTPWLKPGACPARPVNCLPASPVQGDMQISVITSAHQVRSTRGNGSSDSRRPLFAAPRQPQPGPPTKRTSGCHGLR